MRTRASSTQIVARACARERTETRTARRRPSHCPRAPQAPSLSESTTFHSHALARPVRLHAAQGTRPRPSHASHRDSAGGRRLAAASSSGAAAAAGAIPCCTPGSTKPVLPRPRQAAQVRVVAPRQAPHLRGRSHCCARGTSTRGTLAAMASATLAVDGSTSALAAAAAARLLLLAARRRVEGGADNGDDEDAAIVGWGLIVAAPLLVARRASMVVGKEGKKRCVLCESAHPNLAREEPPSPFWSMWM
jgi:hypothetical protein